MPAHRSPSFALAVAAIVTGLTVASPLTAAGPEPYAAAAREALHIAIDVGRVSDLASAVAAGDTDAFAKLVEVDARVQQRFHSLGVLALGQPALPVPTHGPAADALRDLHSQWKGIAREIRGLALWVPDATGMRAHTARLPDLHSQLVERLDHAARTIGAREGFEPGYAFAMLIARLQRIQGTVDAIWHGVEVVQFDRMHVDASTVARAIASLPPGDDAMVADLQAALAPFTESVDAVVTHSTGLLELQEHALQIRILSRPLAEAAERLADQLAATSSAVGHAGG